MNELIRIETPVFYDGWNFEASDKALKQSIFEWRKLTINVLSEAYLMFLFLSNPGKRTDLVAFATRLPTWTEWCKSVSVDRMTFYRHFETEEWIETKQRERERKRLEAAKAGESIIITHEDIDFKHGDFVELSKDIPDGSIDLILTDPPYPKEFIQVWSDLSRIAKRVLKPNGFLIAYSGQLNLSDVMNRLNENLDYYWIGCLRHIGGTQLIMHRNIMCGWKPLLIYQNGFKKTEAVFSDYFISEKQEKEGHDWQQSEAVLDNIIDIFTEPGQTIYEPFAGSGTTIVAAIENKRKCIAHEIDFETFNIAKKRVNDN